MNISKLKEQVSKCLKGKAKVLSFEEMTPDASQRRYFRVSLDSPIKGFRSLVVMYFLSTDSPEAGSKAGMSSDEACVELTGFFESEGIPVPQIVVDMRTESFLLIEDFGDMLLGDLLLKGMSPQSVEPFYRDAISLIADIQNIDASHSHLVSERTFSKQNYLSELGEFLDYSFKGGQSSQIRAVFDDLATRLAQMNRVVCHRDFHSWNILVTDSESLGLIDFQDALLAPRCYDVAALLNDRDTDSLLGMSLYESLVEQFLAQYSDPEALALEYNFVLLQRDLKVVGRFEKLSKERGLTHYERWIPGTLRRIGTTLSRLYRCHSVYGDLLTVLSEHYVEVREGSEIQIQVLEVA